MLTGGGRCSGEIRRCRWQGRHRQVSQKRILVIMQMGHMSVLMEALRAAACMDLDTGGVALLKRSWSELRNCLCAGAETTRHPSALEKCCSSAGGKGSMQDRLAASTLATDECS